jgi:hypothetical protein
MVLDLGSRLRFSTVSKLHEEGGYVSSIVRSTEPCGGTPQDLIAPAYEPFRPTLGLYPCGADRATPNINPELSALQYTSVFSLRDVAVRGLDATGIGCLVR